MSSPGVATPLPAPRTWLLARLTEEERGAGPRNRTSLAWLAFPAAVFAVGIAALAWNPWLTGWVVFPLFGIAQYHLIVAIHEADHEGLFQPRWLNELAGGVIAKLVTFDFEATRVAHMRHHLRFGFPDDPDWPEYHPPRHRGLAAFLADQALAGPFRGFLRRLRGDATKPATPEAPRAQLRHLAILVGVQAAILAVFAVATVWWFYLPFWVLPMVVFAGPIQRIRVFGEHVDLAPETPARGEQYTYARTTFDDRPGAAGWLARLERFVFAPYHFNLHHEHHLLPQVPYHVLPRLHAVLREEGHYRRHPGNLSTSYLATTLAHLRRNRERVA